ncbi:hypothetical protein BDP55DRAFT_234306 [Colletotrichum godetiae]|uniref:Uncharacterized protein n=1 Tax=Colletotrichum godetiae TaxID=1209918 RepID=A0AAJ0AIC1_9PEZI|nr:uncharacterized protein BDP55DRAFT_234306 [Colletotrichum godetiae]KAK1672902.1 hypothetical protein BDP55DRAFT_234306 [Colletotrichum godetiae]
MKWAARFTLDDIASRFHSFGPVVLLCKLLSIYLMCRKLGITSRTPCALLRCFDRKSPSTHSRKHLRTRSAPSMTGGTYSVLRTGTKDRIPCQLLCNTRKDRAGSSYGYWRRQTLSVLRTRIQRAINTLLRTLCPSRRAARTHAQRDPVSLAASPSRSSCSAPLVEGSASAEAPWGCLGMVNGRMHHHVKQRKGSGSGKPGSWNQQFLVCAVAQKSPLPQRGNCYPIWGPPFRSKLSPGVL